MQEKIDGGVTGEMYGGVSEPYGRVRRDGSSRERLDGVFWVMVVMKVGSIRCFSFLKM